MVPSPYKCRGMIFVKKTYEQTLTDALDRVRSRGGNVEETYESCKAQGKEAMSREVTLLVLLNSLKGWDRFHILKSKPALMFPFAFRVRWTPFFRH